MIKRITVVDYGLGNTFSVTRALEHCGVEVLLTENPQDIESATSLILPGVGAFSIGMRGLIDRGLDVPIKKHAASGKPLLGICLGMQLLMTGSEEFGYHTGLDILAGRVVSVVAKDDAGNLLKVPHIGWGELVKPRNESSWDGTILEGVDEGNSVYFVHSYMVSPDDDSFRLADTKYGNCRITAAVRCKNVIGCQFHPEKSAEVGLRILSNFIALKHIE